MARKETTVNITIHVDASELDAAIEKTNRLKRTLEEVAAIQKAESSPITGIMVEIPESGDGNQEGEAN